MKKIIISIILIIIIIINIYLFVPQRIAILTYHDFTKDNPSNNMQINIDNFESQIKYLKENNYKFLKLEDIECFLESTCKLPRKSVLITIDDGYKSSLKLAAKVLAYYDANATIFYIGSNSDKKDFLDLDDLEKIKEKYPNIEIASHTYDLHYDNSYLKSKEELQSDFNKFKEIIDTKYLAYPYGKYSNNYIEVLKENNYSLAFTFGPKFNHRKLSKSDNRYKLPRLNFSTDVKLSKFKLRLKMPI